MTVAESWVRYHHRKDVKETLDSIAGAMQGGRSRVEAALVYDEGGFRRHLVERLAEVYNIPVATINTEIDKWVWEQVSH